MTGSEIVPGSHVQSKGAWRNRYPFVGFVLQPNGTTDAVGFNGARIRNPHTVTAFGVTVLHLGTLKSPVETAVQVGKNIVGLAGDGGTFSIEVVAEYL
jgi:hypothetical protein